MSGNLLWFVTLKLNFFLWKHMHTPSSRSRRLNFVLKSCRTRLLCTQCLTAKTFVWGATDIPSECRLKGPGEPTQSLTLALALALAYSLLTFSSLVKSLRCYIAVNVSSCRMWWMNYIANSLRLVICHCRNYTYFSSEVVMRCEELAWLSEVRLEYVEC